MSGRNDREVRDELSLKLNRAAAISNVLVEYTFEGGRTSEIERKGLNDGSSELALLLDELIGEANRLLAELLDLPEPEPLSTKIRANPTTTTRLRPGFFCGVSMLNAAL